MTRIVVEHIPVRAYNYWQWLLLGLFELDRLGEINLSFRIRWRERIALFYLLRFPIIRGLIFERFYQAPKWSRESCLLGYAEQGSRRVRWAYDSHDTPFRIDHGVLCSVDYYFKAQCPIKIDEAGFPLTRSERIPYSKCVLDNKNKILPAMLGVRRLARALNYSSMKAGYRNLLQSRPEIGHARKLMAYFGSAVGPDAKPATVALDSERITHEQEIVDYFDDRISHPNPKREVAVSLINQLGDQFEGRVIEQKSAGGELNVQHDLVIPLPEFSRYVAGFEYNLNITGFRRSIPNRFVDSFVVGTAILTDELGVRWYQPFGCEVIETVELGYLPDREVDWERFEEDLKSLPSIDAAAVIQNFEEKWSPIAFARYVVSSVT